MTSSGSGSVTVLSGQIVWANPSLPSVVIEHMASVFIPFFSRASARLGLIR